jgi:hypothetical protein
MAQDHVLQKPGPIEVAECGALVAKAVIESNHNYSAHEIAVAEALLDFEWNQNVTDFLEVIAGILQPGAWVPEAYAALVFPIKQRS